MDSLPIELRDKIAEEVANLPCTEHECSKRYLDTEQGLCLHRLSNLNALCLSSKSFHPSGTQVSYRSVHIGTRQLRYFLRTVLENRELASVVEVLRYSFKEYLDTYLERLPLNDEIALPKGLRAKFKTAALQSGYDWDLESLWELYQGSVDAEATLLVQVLPGISVLNLDFPKSDSDDNDSSRLANEGIFRHGTLRAFLNRAGNYPDSLLHNGQHRPLASLQRIHLPRPYMEPFRMKSTWPSNVFWELSQLSGIFWLHGLRSLSIDRCISGTGESDFDMPKEIHNMSRTSSLEDISITSACLEPTALNLILSLPRALKRFKYELAEGEHVLRYREDYFMHKKQWVSPKRLFTGLEQHKTTLQHLELSTFSRGWCIYDYEMSLYYFQSGSEDRDPVVWRQVQQDLFQPILLNNLGALKTLSINVIDLLGTETLYEPERYSGFVDTIPPNLQSLVLQQRDFVDGHKPKDTYLSYYGHIVDLLNSKSLRFRDLSAVTMKIDKTMPLPAESLHQLALSGGISLSVKQE